MNISVNKIFDNKNILSEAQRTTCIDVIKAAHSPVCIPKSSSYSPTQWATCNPNATWIQPDKTTCEKISTCKYVSAMNPETLS